MNDSILKLSSKSGDCLGTGFVIKKVSTGIFVATCGHVIENCKDDILVSDKDAKIIGNQYDEGLDLAILYIDGLQINPLHLCDKSKPDKVRVIGYSKLRGYPKKEPINDISVKYDTEIYTKKKINIIKLYPNEAISKGYSGSPVICQLTNKVIGIVNIQSGDITNYAISAKHLLEMHPLEKADKNKSFVLGLTTKIDNYTYNNIKKIFERNLDRALRSFSTQPTLWVNPNIYSEEEDATSGGKNVNKENEIDIKKLISSPRSIIFKARQQYGLTSLAHYLIKEAWLNNTPSLWFYLDANKIKPYKNSMDKYISKELSKLELAIDDIECVILDDFSDNIKDANKIFNFVCNYFPKKHIIIMLSIVDTPLTNDPIEIPENRDFHTFYLWSLPRNDVRKVISKYNNEKYIGEENDVLNKIVSDLEVLNIPRTPLNCITLLKISEIDFEDSPVNRTEMIKRVLFLLFNIDDIPRYKSRPDLKDTQYILGYFCENMIRTNNYSFTREFFLQYLNQYCKEIEIDIEVDVIFDILYKNNIVIECDSGFRFKFSYWIFYFSAHQMHQDEIFCNYILDNMNYASYPELMEYYTGIDRRRNNALITLTDDINTIRALVEKKCGLPESFNIYDLARWEPSSHQVDLMNKEVSNGVIKSNLPDAVKDKYADHNYDRVRPLDQSINRILDEYSVLKLVKTIEASSKALRNSDYANKKLKHQLLNEILLSFDQLAKVLLVLSPVLSTSGSVAVEGVGFVLDDDFGETKEDILDNILQLIPTNIINWYKDHLYSKKMGPLLYKHINYLDNKLTHHFLMLLIIRKRPNGWGEIIEDYIISESKSSFYLAGVYFSLRAEYKYSFSSRKTLKTIENLIKTCAAKHAFGMKKPNLKTIKNVPDRILPSREEYS